MIKKLKPCPFCGHEVKVGGPEDWKPTFYDPDSGGEPYYFYCECGLNFWTNCYEYEDAVKTWNTRKPMDKVVEQLEDNRAVSQLKFLLSVSDPFQKNLETRLGMYLAFNKAIEIVKGGAE